jgi:hypothetical protein
MRLFALTEVVVHHNGISADDDRAMQPTAGAASGGAPAGAAAEASGPASRGPRGLI